MDPVLDSVTIDGNSDCASTSRGSSHQNIGDSEVWMEVNFLPKTGAGLILEWKLQAVIARAVANTTDRMTFPEIVIDFIINTTHFP